MELKEHDDSTMYVDIACLLDLRMSALFIMGEEYATKAIEAGYHDRITDVLPGIDYQEFKRLHTSGDKNLLKHAVVTPVADIIKDFVKKTLENVINSPFHYQPRIVLNVYPFVLNEQEKLVLAKNLMRITANRAQIDVIYRDIKDVTPLFMKTNFSVGLIYQYEDWLEMHCANGLFEKTQAPEVALLAPAVYFKKPPLPKEGDKNPFEEMNFMASPLIGLQLQPASIFSMSLKLAKKT